MWNTICADARVSISKSLFGLRTTATYTPSNSVIDAESFEYTPADGERLTRHLRNWPALSATSALKQLSTATTWPKSASLAMEHSWLSNCSSLPI